ncbi:MAG: TetR/AcrR family transcriptional regulator [Gammaproteobacteria bacterium]|nr:TetR/AcrR family transcriptional regulator [Gammaproteobacteria bacterium]
MLEAAVRLIVERGIERTTLKEVGELAGYSRGLAGYRFGSKGGLYSFVVKSIGEEWIRELTRVTEGKVGVEALTAATDAHYRFCVEAPDHVRAFYILWFESIGPGSEYKDVIAGIHRRRQRDVMEWIRMGIDGGRISPAVNAEKVARQFCAAIIGIVYQWLVNPGELPEIESMYSELKRTMQLLLPAP